MKMEPSEEQWRALQDALPFNTVCELEDFYRDDLVSIMNEIFPRDEIKRCAESGALDRKHWEIAMSVRALHHFGVLHDKSLILGVGAGTEITSFFLTNHVKRVFATDIYLSAGEWSLDAPTTMMSAPQIHSPIPYHDERLIVQHMDGCRLGYPDDMFDGIYSSSSIEHFGSLSKISQAASEMGRVLKPGGILTLSTEYKVAGPGIGYAPQNTIILSLDMIEDFIVAASGLELVDEISVQLSDETMKYRRDIEEIIDDRENTPNILISHEGYTFCSIHLTLRKGKS